MTREANTRIGLFKVHRIGSRLLFEIPRKELGKDNLLVSEIGECVVDKRLLSDRSSEVRRFRLTPAPASC